MLRLLKLKYLLYVGSILRFKLDDFVVYGFNSSYKSTHLNWIAKKIVIQNRKKDIAPFNNKFLSASKILCIPLRVHRNGALTILHIVNVKCTKHLQLIPVAGVQFLQFCPKYGIFSSINEHRGTCSNLFEFVEWSKDKRPKDWLFR